MKPLLVIYTPPIDIEYKDEKGKTELDHFDEVMKNLSDDYRILHLHFSGIEQPRFELLSIDGTITPLELKELEKTLIDRFNIRRDFDEVRFQEILKAKRDHYGNTEAAIGFAVNEYISQIK